MTADRERPDAAIDALSLVVATIDRLVSPGGCPWDAEQTHTSLAPYLIEEAYEVVDAIEGAGTDAALAEELGDVLLQVVFHARVAQGRGAFGIADVALGLRDKLVRRHPHVFARGPGEDPVDATAVADSWERLKDVEKPDRQLFDGIPGHLPALARAGKVAGRLRRSGVDPSAVRQTPGVDGPVDGPVNGPVDGPLDGPGDGSGDGGDDGATELGWTLFALAADAQARGIDAEAALRGVLRRIERNERNG